MTRETENLILEHLRMMREEIADFRKDVDRRFATQSQRLDQMQMKIDASQYILTSTITSVLADYADMKDRVAALETP